jgi:hypothetical protein
VRGRTQYFLDVKTGRSDALMEATTTADAHALWIGDSSDGLAVSSTGITWISSTLAGEVTRTLHFLPFDTNDAGAATPLDKTGPSYRCMVGDADFIFWSDRDGIMRSRPSGDESSLLAATHGRVDVIAVEGTHVHWLETIPKDGSDSIRLPYTLFSIGKSGGPVETKATDVRQSPPSLAADESGVYFVNSSADDLGIVSSAIVAVHAGTDAPERLYRTSAPLAALAIDATHLDFVEASPERWTRLMRVPKRGGAATLVAADERGTASFVVVSDTHVYWSSLFGILRVAKP